MQGRNLGRVLGVLHLHFLSENLPFFLIQEIDRSFSFSNWPLVGPKVQ